MRAIASRAGGGAPTAAERVFPVHRAAPLRVFMRQSCHSATRAWTGRVRTTSPNWTIWARSTDLLRASHDVISNRSELSIFFGDNTVQTYPWNPWSIFD